MEAEYGDRSCMRERGRRVSDRCNATHVSCVHAWRDACDDEKGSKKAQKVFAFGAKGPPRRPMPPRHSLSTGNGM